MNGAVEVLLSASHPLCVTLTLFTSISLQPRGWIKCYFFLSDLVYKWYAPLGGGKITSGISAQYRGFWANLRHSSAPRLYMTAAVEKLLPATGMEDKNMKNETRNDEAVSPVIATILMVAITVVLAGVLYVWAANLAESNTDGDLALYSFSGADGAGADEVVVTMDQGGDLGWASAKIKVAIGQAAAVTADACDSTKSTTPCYDESGSAWTVGDAVTITTQGCGTDSNGDAITTCTVTVTILNDRDGVTLDTSSIAME